eukprot:766443-Hanusia_phi.AAC.6
MRTNLSLTCYSHQHKAHQGSASNTPAAQVLPEQEKRSPVKNSDKISFSFQHAGHLKLNQHPSHQTRSPPFPTLCGPQEPTSHRDARLGHLDVIDLPKKTLRLQPELRDSTRSDPQRIPQPNPSRLWSIRSNTGWECLQSYFHDQKPLMVLPEDHTHAYTNLSSSRKHPHNIASISIDLTAPARSFFPAMQSDLAHATLSCDSPRRWTDELGLADPFDACAPIVRPDDSEANPTRDRSQYAFM